MTSTGSTTIDPSHLNAHAKTTCSTCQRRNNCDFCNGIGSLETKILDAAKQLRAIESVIVPILKIPTEIMAHIFQCCLSEALTNGPEYLTGKETFIPFTLGSVCHFWRQVVWSSPRLWVYIFIKPVSNPDIVNLVTEWLSRSKTLPLKVHIRESKYDDPEDKVAWRPTLQVLAHCSKRWHGVKLYLSPESFRYLCSQTGDTSLIETIRLSCWNGDFAWGNPEIKLWENHIPKPRKVYVGRRLRFHSVNINWNTVTDVEVYFPIGDCLTILRNAPLLDTCDLTFSERHAHLGLFLTHVVHQNLRHLSIDARGFCPEFLASITLPNLVEFEYEVRSREPNQNDDLSLLPFFERSGFPLTHFKLKGTTFSYGYIRSLLKVAPSITHISLYQVFPLYALQFRPEDLEQVMPAALLNELGETSGIQPLIPGPNSSSIILPCLQSLQFTVDFPFPWNKIPNTFGLPSDFQNLHRRPLKFFGVNIDYLPGRIDQHTISRLQALREVGAHIQFNGFNGEPLVM